MAFNASGLSSATWSNFHFTVAEITIQYAVDRIGTSCDGSHSGKSLDFYRQTLQVIPILCHSWALDVKFLGYVPGVCEVRRISLNSRPRY